MWDLPTLTRMNEQLEVKLNRQRKEQFLEELHHGMQYRFTFQSDEGEVFEESKGDAAPDPPPNRRG